MAFTMCAAYSVVPHLTRQYKRGFPDVDLRVRELPPRHGADGVPNAFAAAGASRCRLASSSPACASEAIEDRGSR
jgi:hypothetical protein